MKKYKSENENKKSQDDFGNTKMGKFLAFFGFSKKSKTSSKMTSSKHD